jgi:hypothetical protein
LKKLTFYIILIGFTSVLFSCKSKLKTDKNEETAILSDSLKIANEYYEAIFTPGANGIFRSVSFDQPLATVKEAENKSGLTPLDEATDFLKYEKNLNADTSLGADYAALNYLFDSENRLSEININYYIQDTSRTNALFDLLSAKFSDLHKEFYIDSDGKTVWESAYKRPDDSNVVYHIAIRKLIKFEEPGVVIELMRFGSF